MLNSLQHFGGARGDSGTKRELRYAQTAVAGPLLCNLSTEEHSFDRTKDGILNGAAGTFISSLRERG